MRRAHSTGRAGAPSQGLLHDIESLVGGAQRRAAGSGTAFGAGQSPGWVPAAVPGLPVRDRRLTRSRGRRSSSPWGQSGLTGGFAALRTARPMTSSPAQTDCPATAGPAGSPASSAGPPIASPGPVALPPGPAPPQDELLVGGGGGSGASGDSGWRGGGNGAAGGSGSATQAPGGCLPQAAGRGGG